MSKQFPWRSHERFNVRPYGRIVNSSAVFVQRFLTPPKGLGTSPFPVSECDDR